MDSFCVDSFLIKISCSNWLGFLFPCHFSLSHLPCTVGLFFSSALVHLSLITLSLFPYLFLHPSFFSSSLFSSSTLFSLHFFSPFPSTHFFFFYLLVLLFAPAFPLLIPLLLHPSPSLPPPYSVRDKFVEVDLKPVCKHCYERLPNDVKRRLAKRERDSKEKKKKLLIPMCL